MGVEVPGLDVLWDEVLLAEEVKGKTLVNFVTSVRVDWLASLCMSVCGEGGGGGGRGGRKEIGEGGEKEKWRRGDIYNVQQNWKLHMK